jgi:hypothetical protein
MQLCYTFIMETKGPDMTHQDFFYISGEEYAVTTRPLRLAIKLDSGKCWYTNEECEFTLSFGDFKNNNWYGSVEHLYPKSNGGCKIVSKRQNLVIAAAFINSLVGNAPFRVKLGLKKELSKVKFFPGVSRETKYTVYKAFALAYLSTFKVDGVPLYPWQWKCWTLANVQEVLYEKLDWLDKYYEHPHFDRDDLHLIEMFETVTQKEVLHG